MLRRAGTPARRLLSDAGRDDATGTVRQTMTEGHLPGTETSQGPDYLYIASRLAAPLFLLLC